MTARQGRGIHDLGAHDTVVQLGFEGAQVTPKLGRFRDALRRPGTRQAPASALQDVCDLGYPNAEGDPPAAHLPRIDDFADKLTSILVRDGTFLVVANWAKVRRAQAAGQPEVEVVDVACDEGDQWWAVLAEAREIKDRDWARRLHLAFRHLPQDAVNSLSLREWESVLGVDYTSLSLLRKPLPEELEAELTAGRVSFWAAYEQTPKGFWDEPDGDGQSSDDEPALPVVGASEDLYDAPASVRGKIDRAGLSEFVRLSRCARSPDKFFDGIRSLYREIEQEAQTARPSRPKGAPARC